MKITKVIPFGLSLIALLAASVAQAGRLSSSSNITFLAFDGQKVKKSPSLQINDNLVHQLVVEVSSIYQAGADSQYFESTPIVLTFNGSDEDMTLLAPNLRSQYEVEKFKNQPHFTLKTASGVTLPYQQDYLKGEGFMPNANVMRNLAEYNAGDGVAAVKQFVKMPMATMPSALSAGNGKVAINKVMVQGENIAEQQLQYWFQQADQPTRQRFLAWAKKQ